MQPDCFPKLVVANIYSPNRHSTVTMSFNFLSPINHIVDVAKRERSVILLGDHREIGRFC